MRSQTASIKLAAANAAVIAASQTPSGAGALTLTSSTVTLDAARRVLATTTGAESGKTLTVSGTDRGGNAIREVLSLPSTSTVQSSQDFLTVTSCVISAAAAAAITVGTSGVASTRWIMLDHTVAPFGLGVAVNLGGVTATVTAEVTLDEPNRAYTDETPQGSGDLSTATGQTWTGPIAFAITGLTSISADTLASYATPARAIRLTVNSGAASAGTRLTVIQQGRA